MKPKMKMQVLQALDNVTEEEICKEAKYYCEDSGLFCFNGMIAHILKPEPIDNVTEQSKQNEIFSILDTIYEKQEFNEDDGEYVLVCDIEENHEHRKEDCFENGVLICDIEEDHEHDGEDCYEYENYSDPIEGTRELIDHAHIGWINGKYSFPEAVTMVKEAIDNDDEY